MISKERIKGMVTGAILSTTVISTVVFASPVKKQLNAVYNNIQLIVDGIEIVPQDPDGKRVDPFVVAGTTYVPVRAISQALGKPVKWDSQKNAVIIGMDKTSNGNIGITKLIETLPPYNDNDYYMAKIGDVVDLYDYRGLTSNAHNFEVLQKTYSAKNSFSSPATASETEAVFLLNGNFKAIKGKFAVPDKQEVAGGLQIFADDKLIFETSEEFMGNGYIFEDKNKTVKGNKVFDVEVSLIGVEQLKLVALGSGKFFNVEFEMVK